MSREPDDDVMRKHRERMERSRKLPEPKGAYDVHEYGWQWSQRVKAMKQAVWRPFHGHWGNADDR